MDIGWKFGCGGSKRKSNIPWVSWVIQKTNLWQITINQASQYVITPSRSISDISTNIKICRIKLATVIGCDRYKKIQSQIHKCFKTMRGYAGEHKRPNIKIINKYQNTDKFYLFTFDFLATLITVSSNPDVAGI